MNKKITLLSSSSTTTATIIPLEWLTTLIFSILFLCFILLLILLIFRIRHSHQRKDTNLYYKCSQSTSAAHDLSVENYQNQSTSKNNYDDLTSIGSYIYPITSTTSLLHTSSPSSLMKSEQYAIIDGNPYVHCSTNNVRKTNNIYDVNQHLFCDIFFINFLFRLVIMLHLTLDKVLQN